MRRESMGTIDGEVDERQTGVLGLEVATRTSIKVTVSAEAIDY